MTQELVEELAKIIEEVEQGLKDAIAENELAEYLSDVLGVERRQVLLSGKGWETVCYRLTLATGGPNVYLVVEPNMVKVEGYWFPNMYEKIILRDADAEEVFETLRELYEGD